jgi:sentrin-specific protease 7
MIVICQLIYNFFMLYQIRKLQMDHAEVSGLLCIGTRETDGGEESYAAEYPKMDQDTNATTKFDVVMETSAMYTDQINTNACLDEYHMSGKQPMEEMGFGSAHPFELPSEVHIYLPYN